MCIYPTAYVQRQAIFEEESKCFEKLQKQYDVDRSTFTRKASRLRGKKETRNDFLEVDGKRVDNDDELLMVWENHYKELHTPKDEPGFDNKFK